MRKNITIWLFHGENGKFSSGVFTSIGNAEKWISTNNLSGVLTEYPLDIGTYDWAINNDFFQVKTDIHKTARFIQSFTSANQNHFHYEDGKRE